MNFLNIFKKKQIKKCEICNDKATTIDVIGLVVRYYCNDCKKTINFAKQIILGGSDNGPSKT